MQSYDIKYEIIKAGLKQWEVARRLGYGETVFSKKLRNGLSKEDVKKVLNIIKEMKGDVENGKN